jgi:hypothetical protein
MHYDDEEEEERELQELPMVDADGPCCICGKPDQKHGCFVCGRPVCYDEEDYFKDTKCGGWILDTWHDAHPEGNEFYCQECLAEQYPMESEPIEDDLGNLDDQPF